MAMSWRVVHFIEENTIEAVPASWVKDINSCFWPPHSALKTKALIKNCISPVHDWDLYQSRLIGELYGDLELARQTAAQAEETLASENGSEGCMGEITKNPQFISDSGSDSNPITSNIFLERSVIKEEIEESEEDESETVNIPILRKVTKGNSALVSKNIQTSIQTNSDKAFKKQVLKMLSIINYKVDQMWVDLNNLKIVENIVENEVTEIKSVFEKFHFPLYSTEDLHNFEIYLKNEEKKKEVVTELSRLGGIHVKMMVKRLMEKIFSNELAAQYSWIGFKKKENFSNLIISQIIIKSVMNIHTSATASEVENAIKLWLVKAKERIIAKTNKQQQQQ